MIVYLARDIPAFVMFCVYGESRSSLLIESTDSMIIASEASFLMLSMSEMLHRRNALQTLEYLTLGI